MNNTYKKLFRENKFGKFNINIANVYGLNVAIVLQILSEETMNSDFVRDNKKWIDKTPENISEENVYLRPSKVKKAYQVLMEEDILVRDKFKLNELGSEIDIFTIDFDKLDEKFSNLITENNEILIVKKAKKKREKREFSGNVKNTAEEMKEIYNSICSNLPQIRVISEKKLKLVEEYLEYFTIEDFEKECEIANDCNFLIGYNDNKWKAGFEFLIKTEKAEKILDGVYNNLSFSNKKSSDYDFVDREIIAFDGELQL